MMPNRPNIVNYQEILSPSAEEKWFRMAVKRIIDRGIDVSHNKTHLEWANLLFDDGHTNAVTRQDMMSRIKRDFQLYFTEGKNYTFKMDKIREYNPQWFDAPESVANSMDDLIRRAIINEHKEAQDPNNVESYAVESIKEKTVNNGRYIYLATIRMSEGSDPRFREGVEVRLRVGPKYYTCTVVDYDFDTGELYLSSERQIDWNHRDSIRVTIDVSFLLESLRVRVEQAWQTLDPSLPIYKFIKGKTRHLSDVEYEDVPQFIYKSLDESQRKAFWASLSKDITFIWGPPGTGKSYTLAAIIRALYGMEDERTVVCCISNVAVDQLVNKVIDIIDKEGPGNRPEPGNLYRAGRSVDDRILHTDYLFPNDEQTERLRNAIAQRKERLDALKKVEGSSISLKSVELKDDINNLRQQLKDHTDYLVMRSRVVFSTIANFVNSSKINSCHFDNLIVDEASMLSFPNLLGLAGKITKRIILVGDFQQLSPISLVPDRYLKTNIFSYCGISLEKADHPALNQLLVQRRSHTHLVGLVNDIFYNGRLQMPNQHVEWIVNEGAYPGKVVRFVDEPDGRVNFTRGGTRQNRVFARKVIEIIDAYKDVRGDFSIGVITPYKGQQSLLRALVAEQHYPIDFNSKIRIGTVHTFQGSEDDVIIFDMVDCSLNVNNKPANIGRLYAGVEGERLVNVAVSRARHKLIVVGDKEFVMNVPGGTVTYVMCDMLSNLLQGMN